MVTNKCDHTIRIPVASNIPVISNMFMKAEIIKFHMRKHEEQYSSIFYIKMLNIQLN